MLNFHKGVSHSNRTSGAHSLKYISYLSCEVNLSYFLSLSLANLRRIWYAVRSVKVNFGPFLFFQLSQAFCLSHEGDITRPSYLEPHNWSVSFLWKPVPPPLMVLPRLTSPRSLLLPSMLDSFGTYISRDVLDHHFLLEASSHIYQLGTYVLERGGFHFPTKAHSDVRF